MKKRLTLLIILLITVSISSLMSQTKDRHTYPDNLIDKRIDNMGYWMRLAERGVVPYNPVIPFKPAEYKSSQINVDGISTVNSTDVPVTSSTSVTESENSVFVDPNDDTYLLQSNNSTGWTGSTVTDLYGANYFQSSDGGSTWGGSALGAGGENSGDPTTAINQDGRQFVNYISSPGGQGCAYSDDGSSWNAVTIAPNPGSLADKNHMWVDNSLASTYEGNLYSAWTDFGGTNNYEVVFSRSTDNGLSWSSDVLISNSLDEFNHGVHLQTGPAGEVYAIWATYPSGSVTENGIGFTKSLDGGVTFSTPVKIISTIQGIRAFGVSKNHRVNSFPVMAVDISDGPNSGNIYVVWSNYGDPNDGNSGTNISVFVIVSSDGGATWSTPVRVNQGPTDDGKEAYSPWIACDPANGVLSAVFYDDRNTTSSSCEAFSAFSTDAGSTWTDFVVSDVSFTPSPIPGLADSYMGDYLGITALNGRVYPCWTDNRGGLYMTYVSPYVIGLNPSFTASTTDICTGSSVTFDDNSSGEPTSWIWSFPGGSPSSYTGQNPPPITYSTTGSFDVSLEVGDGVDTESKTMINYISVQDIFADFDASAQTIVYGNSIQFTDNSICSPTSWMWIFEGGTPASFSGQNPPPVFYNTQGTFDVTLEVSNAGSSDTELKTEFITVTDCNLCESFFSNSNYEWISNVTFNTIDNPSSGDGYQDFTAISTDVNKGNSYNLAVDISMTSPYNEQVWAYIDWNRNCDFTDPGEAYDLGEVNDEGTLDLDIFIPTDATPGTTTMRVICSYLSDPGPCYEATYGETEDYSVNVMDHGITITSPMINTMWMQGEYYEILWQSSLDPSENLRIQLFQAGVLHSTLAFTTSNDGKFIWTVPAGLSDNCDYQIKIYQLSDPLTFDMSVDFCIGTPIVNFTNPIANITWQTETYYPIKWTSTLSPTEPVRLQLWILGETTPFKTLAFNTDNDGLFNWVTPDDIPDGCDYYLKIYRLSDPQQFGTSRVFCFGQPSIDVITPSKLATWNKNTPYFITWTSTLSPSIDVSIDLIKDGTLLEHLSFVTDNDGVFVWTVLNALDEDCDYQIRVTSNDVSTDFGISELFCVGASSEYGMFKEIGLDETNSKSLELNVYPNPASKEVYIDLQNLEGSDLQIAIYDNQGKLVLELSKTEIDNQHLETIDIGHLNNGIYLINVLNDGKSLQKKFLKY